MMQAAESEGVARRSRGFLRCLQALLFITGAVAMGYVALTLLDARLSQQSANSDLDRQMAAAAASQEGQQQPSPIRAPAREGEVLGRIEIPRLGLLVAILEGTTSRTLRHGVGHIAGTAMPGDAGNIGVAGHRDTFFRGLKDIHPSDEILVQTATGLSHYQVDWVRVDAPEDTEVLAPSDDSALTLVTCYPFYYVGPAPKRFIVHARKV
jgi:sortase A